ncbi:hypothetical protein [Pelomonas cellulosilytica]|uniref:Uncharacterized protein n=1 Tax=Pelomonas cellulosilytica TaxID=2906762 RepID=A0ABS8XVX0_9BURK|nr:hypothetical protein [Pelomonas sp. P8]MCE4556809.1 hypothetical protein [Pelomonas sp. P8]
MKLLVIAKVGAAAAAIAAVVLVAAGDVIPNVPPWKVLLGLAVVAAGLFVSMLLYSVVAIRLRALLINWGAVDNGWLWTPDYPEDFKRQRGRQAKP